MDDIITTIIATLIMLAIGLAIAKKKQSKRIKELVIIACSSYAVVNLFGVIGLVIGVIAVGLYIIIKKNNINPETEAEPIIWHTSEENTEQEAEPINLFPDVDRKERKYKAIVAILSILLAISVLLNIFLFSYQNQHTVIKQKAKFIDEMVFVDDWESSRYHKFDCFMFKGDDFWAFNVDAAEGYGYDPCPYCCKN